MPFENKDAGGEMMRSFIARPLRSSPVHGIAALLTLAWWRVRRTRGLLLVTGIGMVAAVMVVCAGPLYSNVALTAGLRGVLSAAPSNRSFIVKGDTTAIASQAVAQATAALDKQMNAQLGPYLGPSHLSLEFPQTSILAINGQNIRKPLDNLTLVTQPMALGAKHLTLQRGRLPRTLPPESNNFTGADLEIALSDEEAAQLKAPIGTTLAIKIDYNFQGAIAQENRGDRTLLLHVVGIFASQYQHVSLDNDPFWHQQNFLSVSHQGAGLAGSGADYFALADTQALISVFDVFTQQFNAENIPAVMVKTTEMFWLREFVPTQIADSDLPTLVAGTQAAQFTILNQAADNGSSLARSPFVGNVGVAVPSDVLNQYQQRTSVVNIPIISLLALEVALMLFFVSLMADLLVDRQTEAIAVLRSRGISRTQVFGAFVTQGLGLGLIAAVIGPLLAIQMAQVLGRNLLQTQDQSALTLVMGSWLPIIWSVRWLALATAGVAVLAMLLSVLRVIRMDVIVLRREAARQTQRPLWRRLNLDLFVLIVMIVGYGFSIYLVNSNALNAQARLLLISPLTIVGAICLLIASLLLFMRLFPRLLTLGAWLATRQRGAASLLAVAQMARAPRQTVRMTLLLALATAFCIFSLVFVSSQARRVQDISSELGGADFSGTPALQYTTDDLDGVTRQYQQIRGVKGAALGFLDTARFEDRTSQPVPVALHAVDARNFAQAATWNTQNSSQSLDSLMQLLLTRRDYARSHNIVPAIVDSSVATSLHLAPGSTFVLGISVSASSAVTNTTFLDVAQVRHIPSVNASPQGPANNNTAIGGVLVDFQTYAALFLQAAESSGSAPLPINYAWLSIQNTPAALASVRIAVNSGDLQLSPLYDERALADGLRFEPLYPDLIGVLIIGAITAILLALLGNLLASWLSARSRLINFAVMRALGVGPGQVMAVLSWELGVVYSVAILLGVAFGVLFSLLVVPALVFTGVPNSGVASATTGSAFYLLQNVPPVRVIFAPGLLLVLLALVVVCLLALFVMVRVVLRPSLSQTLRLNED